MSPFDWTHTVLKSNCILYRFTDIARNWSKIAKLSHPRVSGAPTVGEWHPWISPRSFVSTSSASSWNLRCAYCKINTGPKASTSTRWHFAFELCYHTNETGAPTANPRNSTQQEDTPTIPPSYIRIRAVVWECGEGQAYRQKQTRVTIIHFASSVIVRGSALHKAGYSTPASRRS